MDTLAWLTDPEVRAAYGAATLKYDIAAVLVAARQMAHLSQAALAKIAGVSQAYIAKVESGNANPTIGRVGAMLASMGFAPTIRLVPIGQSGEQPQSVSSGVSRKEHG